MTRTIVAEGYGGPEVLAIQDIELPVPGQGQVLVEVRAAGTNPIDYKLYSGGFGRDPGSLPMPVGMEVSGVVLAVGPGGSGYTGPLTVGDEVIVTGLKGGYAERVIAEAADVGHKPAELSFEQAAGLLMAGGTAWHLLTNTGVGTNDTVLIHGAGGGVGLIAVQLAVNRGASVIATASPARHAQLRGYGAEPIAYGPGLADRVSAIGPVDAALDLVGTDEALDTSVELVTDRARIATIVGFARAPELGIAALTEADGGQAIRDASRPELIALVVDGKLEVTVDKVFPLEEAPEAHRYLQTGHARGKVVLVP
ncbi:MULTISPECIES: NADP-dependent oxidoreductase [unclassified Mycobacterium]|uniref:NADP-dependent oxidoreductase n=1 Tax=unclassified Mycobacterium TaxID=2642494 RepID=UPI0029C71642|nr:MULTISPECIES: NADP-dependent oxidoreductase [unclassified Mycobacterium]